MIELQTVWGAQPALYLFLGGLGAGTFIVAGLIRFITRAHEKAVSFAMWCSIVFMAVGLGLLLLELSAPLRALLMWKSFSNLASSWMAIGAWLLFAGVICMLIAAIAATRWSSNLLKLSEKTRKGLGDAFTAVGMVVALCVAIYTGILLMKAPGVPFWNTPLLPVLFTVSAMDTGVAFMGILLACFEPDGHAVPRVLECSTICLIIAEACVLALFLNSRLAGGNPLFWTMEPGYAATAAASAESWLSGQLTFGFWGLLVAVGLAIPFVLAIAQVAHRFRHGRAVAITASLGVLIGGCALRFITLLAGAHVDIVTNSIALMF